MGHPTAFCAMIIGRKTRKDADVKRPCLRHHHRLAAKTSEDEQRRSSKKQTTASRKEEDHRAMPLSGQM